MRKRYICVALASILCLLQCGCASQAEKETTVESALPAEVYADISDDTMEVMAEDIAISRMEEVDYDGYTFRVLTTDTQVNNVFYHEVFNEGETGEPVVDAVYRRNLALEEKYNIKVCGKYSGVFDYSTFAKSVPSGDDMYDVVMANQESALQFAIKGYLSPLNKMENICLDEAWWQQSYNSQATMLHNLYFGISAANLASFESVPVLFFNKQMVQNLALEAPYQKVYDGKWTFDALMEYCSLVSQDLNGDGKYYDEDMYGLLVNSYAALTFIYGGDFAFSEKDEEDVPVFGYDEAFVTYFQKIVSMLTENNTVMYGEKMSNRTQSLYIAFKEDRGLFYNEMLTYANNLRDMDTDFGIVPMPKRDEMQEHYTGFYHFASSSIMAIPVTVSNVDRTSHLTEDMAYYSRQYVYPAYIENSVKTKSARDEMSADMVDYALAHISSDILFSHDITMQMRTLFTKGSTDVASKLESLRSSQDTRLRNNMEKLREIQ